MDPSLEKRASSLFVTPGRKSALSLSRPDIATMESRESVCNPDNGTGFIELQPRKWTRESFRSSGRAPPASA